jgi:putative zinc finger/helix-turn-helix YgiT family protein
MNTKCIQCGTEMKEGRDTHKYDEGGLDVTLLNVPVWKCPNCGEREVDIFRIDELNRLIATEIAEQEEKLGPREIRFLRKFLGLSSSDLATKMHVDPSSVSRWERIEPPGQMDTQAELLLRFLALNEKPIEEYPIEEMATKAAKPKKRRFSVDKKGWHSERTA